MYLVPRVPSERYLFRIAVLWTFALVVGCASSDAPLPELDGGGSSEIANLHGTITHEDRLFDVAGFTGEVSELASAGVRVGISWARNGTVLTETRSDETGSFTLGLDSFVGRRVQPWLEVDVELNGQRVHVSGHGMDAPTYRIVGETFVVGKGEQRWDVRATEDSPLGAALHIAGVIRRGFATIDPHIAQPGPPLSVQWEQGRNSSSCGTCFFADNPAIILLGGPEDTDEFDDDIILHELGHYVSIEYGADSNLGGEHRDRQVEPPHAYSEGLAYFFAALTNRSPIIVDTYRDDVRVIDMESVTLQGSSRQDFFGTDDGTVGGRYREEIVSAVMWDSFDPASEDEPFDALSMDVEAQLLAQWAPGNPHHVDRGPRGIDLVDWTFGMLELGADRANLQLLLDDRDFPFQLQIPAAGTASASTALQPLRSVRGQRTPDAIVCNKQPLM